MRRMTNYPGGRDRCGRKSRRTLRPGLEQLERRTLLAVVLDQSVVVQAAETDYTVVRGHDQATEHPPFAYSSEQKSVTPTPENPSSSATFDYGSYSASLSAIVSPPNGGIQSGAVQISEKTAAEVVTAGPGPSLNFSFGDVSEAGASWVLRFTPPVSSTLVVKYDLAVQHVGEGGSVPAGSLDYSTPFFYGSQGIADVETIPGHDSQSGTHSFSLVAGVAFDLSLDMGAPAENLPVAHTQTSTATASLTWQLASQTPVIKPTPMSFESDGGLDYGYQITGGDLPQATTVDLYWASGTTTDTEIGDPIATTTTDTAQGTYPLQAAASDLADRPQGAEYLLAVADPDNSITPADPSKVESLALPDITATDMSFGSGGGVDYGYQISGADLPQATTVDLYWASGTTPDTEIGDPISTTTTDTAHGTYPLQAPASDLANRPKGADYLLAVVDPDNVISPDDPMDKVKALLVPDLKATELDYIQQPTLADDQLKIGYSVQGLKPSDSFFIDLFWSKSPDYQGIDHVPAYDVPKSNINNTDGSYTLTVPLTALTQPPSADYQYLILQVDSARGTKYEGDIKELDEANNLLPYDTTPEVEITDKTDWNPTTGGVDIDYFVNNRFWLKDLKDPIDARLFWGSTPATAPTDWIADPGSQTLSIPPGSFVPPGLQDDTLTIVFDVTGGNPNNPPQRTIPLIGLTPTIDVTTSGTTERKQSYDVTVSITNNAPVPMLYRVDWQESGPDYVRDTASAIDQANADTSAVGADRSGQSDDLLVGFGDSEQVNLGTTDGKGSFNRTWNWIPPLKVFADLLTGYATKFGKSAAGILQNEIYSLLQLPTKSVGEQMGKDLFGSLIKRALPSGQDTIDQALITYTVNVTALASSGVSTSPDPNPTEVTLLVPLKNTNAFSNFLTLLATTQQLIDATAKDLQKHPDHSIIDVPVFGAAFLAALPELRDLYQTAVDPPDPKYMQIAQPQPAVSLSLSPDLAGVWERQAEDFRTLSGLDAAIATTSNRALGAEAAGDALWESRQLIALSDFADQAASLHGELATIASLIGTWIGTALAPGFEDLKTEIGTSGLPDSVVSALTEAGADQQAISLVAAIITASPDDLLAAPDLGQVGEVVQLGLMGELAISDLVEGVSIRVTQLGESVGAISDSQKTAIQAEETVIDTLLSTGVPSADLSSKITGFLAEVRGLIEETNNSDALLGDLEFGYGALFKNALLDATPAGLDAYVSRREASGDLPPKVASDLHSTLATAQAALAAGAFDGANQAMGSFMSYVDSLAGSSIPTEVAAALASYAGRIKAASDPLPTVTANDDHFAANSDADNVLYVLANDASPGDTIDPASLTLVTPPAHGVAVVSPLGWIDYKPAPGFTGTDTFTYTVKSLSEVVSNVATVTITVPSNDVAPVVSIGPRSQIAQRSMFLDSGSFSSPANGSFTATVDYGDGTGIQPLALNSDRSFTLAHTYARAGAFTVTVSVTDPFGDTGKQTFAETVTIPAPTAPPPSGFGAGRDAFVTVLYRDDLNRLPEPSGLRFWSRTLSKGIKPLTVARAIWHSREHRNLMAEHRALSTSFFRSFKAAMKAGWRAADQSHHHRSDS